MTDFEADNAVVCESLAQVQGKMDLFQGNMEANPAVTAGATVETPVETVVPTSENRQLVPADMNRLAAAYPWGMP